MRRNFVLPNYDKPLLFFFLTLIIAASAWSQTDNQELYSITELRELRETALGKDSLSDEMRTTLDNLYTSAIEAMGQADEFKAVREEYERELVLTDRTEASLLAELAEPVYSPVVEFPESMTVDQAEDALSRERARHSANLAELHDQQLIADDMSESRSDLSQQLGGLDQRIDLLNREYRSQQGSTEADAVRTAEKLRIQALIAAAESESGMLRSRLDLLTAKSRYIPLNIDLAQRRVNYSQELVDIYKAHAAKLQEAEAESSLKLVNDLSVRLSTDFPRLSDLTAETESMALSLWGPEGIINQSEQISQNLSEARNQQAQLRRITELTLRKFETYGNRGNLNRWWPDMPDDFPEHGEVTRVIDHLEKLIPEVDHQLIILSQKRSKAYEMNRRILDENLSTADKQRLQKYLALRQNLLDQLIQRGGVYTNHLVEYQEVSKNFLKQIMDVESFLYSHVLWSRSVPKPLIPKFRDITASAAWAFSPDHWGKLSFRNKDFKPGVFIASLLFILLVSTGGILHRRLDYLAQKVLNPETDRFSYTPRTLMITLLLAMPIPLGLGILGQISGLMGESLYWDAVAESLGKIAVVTALLETTRMVFIRNGLAESHFRWPEHVTRGLYKGLRISEILSMPILYFSLILAFAGGRLDSHPVYRVYHNSLGRIAFIISMLILGLSILSLIKPEKRDKMTPDYARVPWPRRFSAYAFPKAFLGAYPLIFFATIIPAVLAMAGYYLTGILLAYQMLRTMILLLTVFLVSGLIQRGRQLSERKLQDSDSDRQTRGLYKFLMIGVITIGIVVIWSDALPMLQFLKRVQILPEIRMIEAPEEATIDLGVLFDSDGGEMLPEQNAGEVSGTAAVEPDTGKLPLTLWMIVEAALAAAAAVVFVRGLPDIMDLILRHRTTLDHGARFAVRTLLKYSLTILGTIAVFNFLGMKWSQIQWLAAALTFGLGFGLQEIVANFVSGLILLVERPIRVDDVVTIGELMGQVSRIQIRATTITLWDRSEMVVPNKEFVTTKLVNWTLSDSKRRIDIPLRVVYGTDLEQVKTLLVSCAEENPLVLEDPKPHAIIIDFAQDAINFELRFVVDFGNGIQVRDEVQMAVDRIFKDNGIAFAMPLLNVQMTRGKPDPDGSSEE